MTISESRRFFNETLLPRWAKRFDIEHVVFDIGVSKWDYSELFRCNYQTVDREEKRRPDLLQDIEEKKLPECDGVVLNGVFEQSDDPFLLLQNVRDSLHDGGQLLAGLIGHTYRWTSNRDKWRVTRAGALEYCKGFHIDQFYELPGYYFVLGTKR